MSQPMHACIRAGRLIMERVVSGSKEGIEVVWAIVFFLFCLAAAVFAYGMLPGVASTSMQLVTWVFMALFVISMVLIGWNRPARR